MRKEFIGLGTPGNDNSRVSTTLAFSLSVLRTYEMELRLSDAKKKDEDMGVILVDVCLMFRDATIKKGLVRRIPASNCSFNVSPCFIHLFIHSCCFLFQKWVQRKNKVWNSTLFFLVLTLSCPGFHRAIFTAVLGVTLMMNTRGQYHTAL